MVAYTRKLPEKIQKHPFIKEQMLLAQSSLGDHTKAIAGLQELIKIEGDTPERRGLIGGRFKRLWREARDKRKAKGQSQPDLIEQGYLENAIENYRQGMKLNLNDYYCASNLPALLRARGRPGESQEAEFLDQFIVTVTQRKIDRGEDDGWARSTLLGAAFRVGNVDEAARLIKDVGREGPAVWQLESTLKDIEDALSAMPDSPVKQQLAQYHDQLSSLLKAS
jgi:tetratricopeptide (TPR) repeat protein